MNPFEIGFRRGMLKAAAKGHPGWRSLPEYIQREARAPKKPGTYHTDSTENLATYDGRKGPKVEKARFVEGAQHRAKLESSRHYEKVKARDTSRAARQSSPHVVARKNPMVHVPAKPGVGDSAKRSINALRVKMKGMSGKQKVLLGGAAIAALLGTGAAAYHGSKPSYERLSEKPKKRG